MIDLKTFSTLYSEAVASDSLDFFISERGWQQDWMDGIGISKIVKILEEIFFLAHSGLRQIREKYGYSRVAFSRAFYIPSNTLLCWENGSRTAPPYVTILLYYALFLDAINKEAENGTEK